MLEFLNKYGHQIGIITPLDVEVIFGHFGLGSTNFPMPTDKLSKLLSDNNFVK